jgi:hypothetical protein
MKVLVDAHIEKIEFKGDEAKVTLTLGKMHGKKLNDLTSAKVKMEVDDMQDQLLGMEDQDSGTGDTGIFDPLPTLIIDVLDDVDALPEDTMNDVEDVDDDSIATID